MPRRSRPSARQSTTSPRTSSTTRLGVLIDELPPDRAAAVFTHASWASDRSASYERLEFLGDSVLEMAIARALYDRYPEFAEGRMAKVRSHVVSRASCAVVSRELGLGERLRAAASSLTDDEAARLAANRNVLAAVLEAALAGLFLEHGFEQIEEAIVEAFEPRIEYAVNSHVDHKTELQEQLARSGRSVNYVVLNVEGPPHDRTFTAAAVIEERSYGTGTGSSKKDAEQAAAAQALEALSAEAGDAGSASPQTG